MKDTAYAFCVARIRANERKLLDQTFISKLIDADSFETAVSLLKDSGWTDKSDSIKEIINDQNEKLWNFLSESVPDKNEINRFCVLNDFFNIKCAVKCAFSGEDPTPYFVRPTSVNLEDLSKNISSGNYSALNNQFFISSAKEAYDLAFKTENGQNAEIVIDRTTLEYLMFYSKKSSNSLFSEICDFYVDTSNIKTAFRCIDAEKNMDFVRNAVSKCRFIDSKTLISCIGSGKDALNTYLLKTVYGDGAVLYDTSPVSYEKWCDERILKIISKAKYTAFGFDPVCAYYYTRLNEIKNVRIILTSLQSGVPSDTIRERVRIAHA